MVQGKGSTSSISVPELKGFLDSTAALKALADKILAEKKAGGKDSSSVKKGLLQLATVKASHRDAHEAAERLMQGAEDERQRTDAVSQQLQNLQYQKIHLHKELHMCLNYQAVDIDVISEAEFEANVPAGSRGGERGSHGYELARLSYEMQRREEQVKVFKSHTLRKQLYEQKLAGQRKFLDSIHGYLDNVTKAAEPLVKEFTKGEYVSPLETADVSSASLLPAPLYAVYLQAHSYQEAVDKRVAAEILGDTKDAQAFIKASAAAAAETPGAAEGEAGGEGKRKKRKAKHLGDGQARSEALAPHPLSILLRVPGDGGAPTVTLTFSYLPKLQVVTVKHALSSGVNDDGILQDLWPEDTGAISPNPSTDYLVPNNKGPLIFSDKVTQGRSYKWAQSLGGLNHLPRMASPSSAPPPAIASVSFAEVFSRVQRRAGTWAEVKELLVSLKGIGKGGLPAVPGSDRMQVVSFDGWTDRTLEVRKQAGEVAEDDEGEVGGGDVEMGGAAGGAGGAGGEEGEVEEVKHATESDARQVVRQKSRHFRTAVKKGAWQLRADIEVEGGYPQAPPRFKLSVVSEGTRKGAPLTGGALLSDADPMALSAATGGRQAGEATDNNILHIEKEVNMHAVADAASAGCPAASLLAYQLWVLGHCFSIYVDVESGAGANAPRDHRGRDRRLPFLQSAGSRTLEHRP